MKKHLQLAYTFRKLNIQWAMAYRVSFWTAVISMVVNDVVLIAVFYFLYQRFGTIGGIDFQWYLKLNVVVIFVYVFMSISFHGARKISAKITNGEMDWDLLLPKNLLLRLITNGINVSAYGDFLFAIILLFFIKDISLLYIIKLIAVSIFGGLSFLWFVLIFESLWFWIGSSREIANMLLNMIVWPALYPEKIFEWTFFAILFKTLIPVFFIIYLPYRLSVWVLNIVDVLLLIGASLVLLSLGIFIFYKWLKRYESWNAININM